MTEQQIQRVLGEHQEWGHGDSCSCGWANPNAGWCGNDDRHRAHVAAKVAEALAAQVPEGERLCSQCGERMSAMVKIGTDDGWCTVCLDESAEGEAQVPDISARVRPCVIEERSEADGSWEECVTHKSLLPCDGEATADEVIDAIEETFLAQLPTKALTYCAQEDVNAGLDAMRERFNTPEHVRGERP